MKVEMGLVEILEQKYQAVANKLDKAELQSQQSKFKEDIVTQEKI